MSTFAGSTLLGIRSWVTGRCSEGVAWAFAAIQMNSASHIRSTFASDNPTRHFYTRVAGRGFEPSLMAPSQLLRSSSRRLVRTVAAAESVPHAMCDAIRLLSSVALY